MGSSKSTPAATTARGEPAHPPELTRVALVGCGQIADAHLKEIAKIDSATVVGVCDYYPELAEQAAQRFHVDRWFADIDTMIQETRPDVVHITTPVQTHAALATQVLRQGVHVYLEKPFTVDLDECQQLLQTALDCERWIQVGHDQSYDPIWLECLRRVRAGHYGEIQHIDSVLAYPLNGPFGQHVLADKQHWVRRLPGGLFQNTISHPLYKITDLMLDDQPEVWASWFNKEAQADLPTELRVHLRGEQVTANLLFTSNTKPLQRVVRLYGSQAGCEVDFDAQTIRTFRSASLPGALGKLQTAAQSFREAASNLLHIGWRFLKADLHYFAGMEHLFRAFYAAIRNGEEPPIRYPEIERVTRILDEIFVACDSQAPPAAVPTSQDQPAPVSITTLEECTP